MSAYILRVCKLEAIIWCLNYFDFAYFCFFFFLIFQMKLVKIMYLVFFFNQRCERFTFLMTWMDFEYGMGTFGDLLPASSYHKSINIINGTLYAKWKSYVITTLLTKNSQYWTFRYTASLASNKSNANNIIFISVWEL